MDTFNRSKWCVLRVICVIFVWFFAVMLQPAIANESKTLTWQELIPLLGTGSALSIVEGDKLVGAPDRESFDGDEEDYQYLVESFKFTRYSQPQGAKIRSDLDGQTVRIPGYITPLGFDQENVTEFLLVPYLGACIHVPPPPGNQIVYVKDVGELNVDDLYDPIWVTGTISAKPIGTVLADVGYQISSPRIEPYE